MTIDLPDDEARRGVLLGNQAPSAIEQAVGTNWSAPGWANNLDLAVLETFDNGHEWIKDLLATPPEAEKVPAGAQT
jgi:hypothetical protein